MKKKLFKITATVFALLLCAAAAIVLYAVSPLHPKNISDETVVQKGTEYTVKLEGVYEYDEEGFDVATDGFYLNARDSKVYKDEDGFARTSYEGEGEVLLHGDYNSGRILYDKYSFCGENYKSRQELEAFFESPDPIYNFDIDKLSYYISDIITYEKQFYGTATVRIYRGRCVFTEIYIGEEKVLELK